MLRKTVELYKFASLMTYFHNNSITMYGSKNFEFATNMKQLINYYTFDDGYNEVISVGNTFWENGEEISIFNKTLEFLVCLDV